MITNSQSPNLQREIIRKKITFFNFAPGNLLVILYQLTKFEAPSCNTFREIMITNSQSPNLQREVKKTFCKFAPGKLHIILYQLTKFEAPSCNAF